MGPPRIARRSALRPGPADRRLDPVVVRLHDQAIDDLVEAVDRARALRPRARVLVAANSSHATVFAELISITTHDGPRPAPTHLTARECEVLAHIRHGLTNREISARLGVSLSTVNKHVENLLDKLPARNRAQAVAEAASIEDQARVQAGDQIA